jgi:hypothetical protein
MALSHNPRIVTDGLVLCLDAANPKSYPGSGPTWKDLSKTKNSTTIYNSPTLINNSYFNFDGIDDYCDTGLTASDIGMYDSSYSCESIFSIPNTSGDKHIFGTIHNSTRRGLHIGVRNSYFYHGHYGADNNLFYPSIVVNKMYHLFWTYDGTYSRIYVNGELLDTGAIGSFLGTTNILIAKAFSTSTHYNMNIAIAKIYNRALAASEIKQNYNALKGRFNL